MPPSQVEHIVRKPQKYHTAHREKCTQELCKLWEEQTCNMFHKRKCKCIVILDNFHKCKCKWTDRLCINSTASEAHIPAVTVCSAKGSLDHRPYRFCVHKLYPCACCLFCNKLRIAIITNATVYVCVRMEECECGTSWCSKER